VRAESLDAAEATSSWAKLWRLEALRYRGSGWWLDRVLPHSPIGLVAFAVVLPLAWLGSGYALTGDRATFLATPDVIHQLWFLPLHVVCLRVVGGLWSVGLPPALAGLGLDEAADRRIRWGAYGTVASIGALVLVLFFIARDIHFGLTPGESGLIPFDDPDMWGFGTLGRPVHALMLVLWCVEWLLFGYLLWVQVWTLYRWLREINRADFANHLDLVVVHRGYRASFVLLGRTATVSLVFALGNLGFIYLTGELIPREAVHIEGFGDFMENMSDVISTALLFVFSLVALIGFVVALRKTVHRSVGAVVKAASIVAIAEEGNPLALTGDANVDVVRLHTRLEAQGQMIRAIALQHEADKIGGRALATVVLKAALPLITTALKIRKMFV
jgi:hypothetical protein